MSAAAQPIIQFDEDEEAQVESTKPRHSPGSESHRCTDVAWLVVFLLALGSFLGTAFYAAQHGDVRRLRHGCDYQGRLCGVDVPGNFVFWCRAPSGSGLELNYPICISECPDQAQDVQECYNPARNLTSPRRSYATRQIGNYCMPQNRTMVNTVAEMFAGDGFAGQFHRAAAEICRAWLPLLSAAVISACMGCFYLFLVDKFTNTVLYASTFAFVMVPFGSGYYLLKAALQAASDGTEGSGDFYRNLFAGCILLAIGTFVLLVAIAAVRMLQRAVGLITATCDCLLQEPTLILQPFLALAFRGALLAVCARGLLLLLSCGAVGEHGFRKKFEYTPGQYCLIAYYIVMMLWMFELCGALSQYTLAWVTQRWYFTPYVNGAKAEMPRCAIFRALFCGMRYHMGTMAFGALVTAVFRIPRTLMLLLPGHGHGHSRKDGAARSAQRSEDERRMLNPLNIATKNAYMDVALHSESFCGAAASSKEALLSESSVVVTLNGAQWIFLLTGYGAITSIGAISAVLLVQHVPVYNMRESSLYISDPLPVVLCATLICFWIASTFMVVFDMVGDTILYCFVVDQKSKDEQRQASLEEHDEQPESWASWLFTGGVRCALVGGEDSDRDDEVHYTPRAVQELIKQHGPSHHGYR